MLQLECLVKWNYKILRLVSWDRNKRPTKEKQYKHTVFSARRINEKLFQKQNQFIIKKNEGHSFTICTHEIIKN